MDGMRELVYYEINSNIFIIRLDLIVGEERRAFADGGSDRIIHTNHCLPMSNIARVVSKPFLCVQFLDIHGDFHLLGSYILPKTSGSNEVDAWTRQVFQSLVM